MLLLKQGFTKWPAFELGIIDDKGNKIKEPKTKKEKESLDGLTNLVRKIKKLLGKYIPNEKLLAFLITVYLMKESIENKTNSRLAERCRTYFSDVENNLIYDILVENTT